MSRKYVIAPGEYYHIYNRGVDKRIIFKNSSDYHRFILLLYFCNSSNPVDLEKIFREGRTFPDMFNTEREKPLVSIGAWCLMPNHFHLLLKETSDMGIVKFMQKITTGYSMYFNKKYTRSGTLFQGKFKSEHATNDNYLKYLFSYIHLNPIKLIEGESKWKEVGIHDQSAAVKFLEKYEYSSFNSYTRNNSTYRNILKKDEFPIYFDNPIDHLEELSEWLNYQDPTGFGKVEPSQN